MTERKNFANLSEPLEEGGEHAGALFELNDLLPGKSKQKPRYLAFGLSLLAACFTIGALLVARTPYHHLCPLPALAGLLLMFWIGTIRGAIYELMNIFNGHHQRFRKK